MELLGSTVPSLTRLLEHSFMNGQIDQLYDQIAPVDFSSAVLTRMPGRLLVLRDSASGWTDLGSPRRVADVLLSRGIQPSWLSPQPCGSSKVLSHGVGVMGS